MELLVRWKTAFFCFFNKSRLNTTHVFLYSFFLFPERPPNTIFELAVVEKSSWRTFCTIGRLFLMSLRPREWPESVSEKPNEFRTELISNRTNNDCWVVFPQSNPGRKFLRANQGSPANMQDILVFPKSRSETTFPQSRLFHHYARNHRDTKIQPRKKVCPQFTRHY